MKTGRRPLPAALTLLLAVGPGVAALPPVKTVRVQGVPLAYVEKGRGQPVVLLHGFGHDYRIWTAELESLSKSYRVFAYSRRHNAPNPERKGGADYTDAVAETDLAAFIRTLNLGRVHLIGHSAGAGVALLAARDHPRLVRSLILAEPVVDSVIADHAEAQALMAEIPFGEAGRLLQSGNVEGAARLLAAAIIGRENAYDALPPDIRRVFLENLPREMKAAASAPTDAAAQFTCDDARRIHVPTLFIQGENTLELFRLAVEELHKCMPGSKLAILPGTTHALELENPEGFDEIVLKFLSGR
jgi:pimeloyl-ACP methyl ester carboxylesterase